MTKNVCHKGVANGDTGTFQWLREIDDFPMCQKCHNFERHTLDKNLEMECVPDKMVRYRQSCTVKCTDGQTLFVNGSRQSQVHGMPTLNNTLCFTKPQTGPTGATSTKILSKTGPK